MNLADLEILEYSEDMGKVCWPAGFAQELEGKTLRQQLEHYRVADWGLRPLSYYLVNWAKCSGLETLDRYAGWEKIIVRDGKIVGFVRRGKVILPYWVVYSDSDSDNNGAGYKERTYYYYLVCVPGNLGRERSFTPPFGVPEQPLPVPVIDYDGSRGEDLLPEELAKRLEGKSLYAQMFYFAVHECNPSAKEGWADDWEKYAPYYIDDLCRHRRGFLPFRDDLAGLIVHGGKIVGVRIRLSEDEDGPTADLYPYEVKVCAYIRSYTSSPDERRRQLIGIPLPG